MCGRLKQVKTLFSLQCYNVIPGTLDRCIEGETAKIILDDTTKSMKPHSSTSSISPVQVCTTLYQ